MALIEIDWKPDLKQLRQFGLISAIAFPLIGLFIGWRGGLFGLDFGSAASTLAWGLGVLGLFCGVLGAIRPQYLAPLYIGLIVITFPIGFVISYVMMTVLFFGIITPFGWGLRLAGRDPLEREPDPNAESYWIDSKPMPEQERYFRQY